MEGEMDESWINNDAATVAPKENGACQKQQINTHANEDCKSGTDQAEARADTVKDSSESNDGRNIRDFDLNIPLPGLGGGSDYYGNVKVKFPPPEQEIIDLSGSSPEILEPPTSKALVSDQECGSDSNGAVIKMSTRALNNVNVSLIDLAGSIYLSDKADDDSSPRSKKLKITDGSKDQDN
ncbi:hypothetical protein WN944_020959 [Citrus x changshan-huyou]|uniref:Uncharacterized protein n=1 Tax=Citrus x changshan-huyou TaxID=2935761 RepID=A0AAP0R003_9ROSI